MRFPELLFAARRGWRLLLLTGALLAPTPLRADEAADGDGEEHFVVVKAKRIITNTGKPVANGVIVIVNGKVRNVGGSSTEYPGNAKVIDAGDRVVMPGMIAVNSRLGLPGYSRTGVHGNWAVESEFFPRDSLFEDFLAAGYTAAAFVPDGEGVTGRSLITRTGGPAATRVLKSPGFVAVTAEKKTLREGLERAKKEIEKVDKAREKFDEEQKKRAAAPPVSQPATAPATTTASAPASQPAFKPPPIDPAHEVLVDLIQKKTGIEAQVELRRASDYLHFADLFEQFEIAHHFIARTPWTSDFYRVAQQMGEKKLKVAVWPYLNRIPYSTERINIVKELSEAGCEVSILPAADSSVEFERVRQRTAQLVAAGWKRETALKALTLHPARLLGLDSRFGTIEKDRDADLIFLDADPFAADSRVCEVMIAGEIVWRRDATEKGSRTR